jgi:hypothetical protein
MLKHLSLLTGLYLAACNDPWLVKGNPIDLGDFVGTGGKLDIPGCGYAVTTRMGAEPPEIAQDAFGTDPTPKNLHLSFVGDPKTSIVAQWRTEDEVTRASTIRFAKGANLTAADLTEKRTGITFGFKAGGTDGLQHVFRVHQAHLCGLEAGTTYSYQIGGTDPSGNVDHYSPIYTFHTAPDINANPDAEVVFGFVGDSRGGYDIWTELLAEIKSRSPDVVLFSGDAVTLGPAQYEWEDFYGLGESLFATVPIVFAHGNHEANSVNYYSQLAQPGDQQNFGLDYGYAHITVANDTPDDPASLAGDFKNKLSDDFAASSSARWKIFMHHQPMWSASTKHGSNTMLRDLWQPLVDQYHIDLVLNGHDHDYEVTHPLIGTNLDPNGTVYVVAGGAGAELYDNDTQFWTAYSEKTYSAAMIHVRQDRMTMDAFRQDGTPLPTGYDKMKQ